MRMDLTGRTFGRLKVMEPSGDPIPGKDPKWKCLCECGNTKIVRQVCLLHDKTKSCGCLRREVASARHTTHGLSGKGKSSVYHVWKGMMARCYDPNSEDYHRYGGRGVEVCAEWRCDFMRFREDMGPRPFGTSIDRFPDNNGNYEPGNCRWATAKQQANNRRKRSIAPNRTHGKFSK